MTATLDEHSPAAVEKQNRTILERAAVGIIRSSAEGELRWANRAFLAMSGYPRDEVRKLRLPEIFHPDDIECGAQWRTSEIEEAGTLCQRELRLLCRDGSYLWVSMATSLVRGAQGRQPHYLSVLHSISERKRAEEEANRFRAAIDVALDSIFLSDPRTMRLIYVNDTACYSFGYTRAQLLQKPSFELFGKTRAVLAEEYDQVIAAAERGSRTQARYVRADGSTGWAEFYRRALPTESGLIIVTIARDITERRAQQERIRRVARVEAMLSGIHAAMLRIRDRQELFRESCRIAHEAGGFDTVSIRVIDGRRMVAEPIAWHGRGQSAKWPPQSRLSLREEGCTGESLLLELVDSRRPLIVNDALQDSRVHFKEAMAACGINSIAFLPLTVADVVTAVMTLYSPQRNYFDSAEIKILSDMAADISFALEHLEKHERAAFLALYDELTGLANRRLLAERLAQLMSAARPAQGQLALALIDIQRLRSINKSLGRHAGDVLLRQVAERLSRTAGASAVARIASNHFAIVQPTTRGRVEAESRIAEIVGGCFKEPFCVEETELKIGVKTGLAMFPGDAIDADTLLANAEMALRQAKQTGERQAFYVPAQAESTGNWPSFERHLGRALERNEFILHYQLKVDAGSRRTVGLEALLRWQSPEFGLVRPVKFMQLLEETGMILDVGDWVLRRAVQDQLLWRKQGQYPPRVAVNVSALQLRQRDFVNQLEKAIHAVGAPQPVDLEITETVIMEDLQDNIGKLHDVRALGVRVAIDDFGTGYSSLHYLAKLPVQAIKVDRSFVHAMLDDPAAMTLVQTIISLARTLELEVVAEGVEREEQAKILRLLRCDQFQGYLINQPEPFAEVTRLLQRNTPA